jgi:hypothetical protein
MLPLPRENHDDFSTCILYPNIGSNVGSNVSFVGDTKQSYMRINSGMFKYPSLMGIFPLPPPFPTDNVDPINMISLFTSGSFESFDPWVVPRLEDVESYGASMPLIAIDIVDPMIP